MGIDRLFLILFCIGDTPDIHYSWVSIARKKLALPMPDKIKADCASSQPDDGFGLRTCRLASTMGHCAIGKDTKMLLNLVIAMDLAKFCN